LAWQAVAGLVECPVEGRGQAEQRVVEHGHDRAHLVGRADRLDPQRRGEPQQPDLLPQPPPDLRLLRREPGGVQVRDQAGDPPQRGRHRPAAGLGGVRGEHRLHPQPGQQVVQLAGFGAEPRHRGGQRLPPWAEAGGQIGLAAQGPHPVPFLGQVGQVEVDRECLGHQFGASQWPARHQRRDLVAGQVGLVSRWLVPGGDDRAAQPFHVVEQALAARLADHLAEQVAEEPDIPPQGDGQFLAVRFPGHCPQPSAVQIPGTGRQMCG